MEQCLDPVRRATRQELQSGFKRFIIRFKMVANSLNGSLNGSSSSSAHQPVKSYDYVLKFLLVGDSDVGKQEILDSIKDEDAESESSGSGLSGGGQEAAMYRSDNVICKSTTILLDGKRIKLHLW